MLNKPQVSIAVIAFGFLFLTASLSNADDHQFRLRGFDKTDVDVLNAKEQTGVLAVRWNSTRISDAALKVLRKWPDLYGVYLQDNSVTGSGLEHLHHHKKLRQVTLLGPNVNDEGLAELKHVKHVTHLQIGNGYQYKPQITNRGFQALSELKQLQYLDIDGALITDEGLRQLAEFKQLKYILFLRCPRITKDGVKRLRNALPKAAIRTEFDSED